MDRAYSEPRVLILDIETLPFQVFSWGNDPQLPIHHDNIVKEAEMLSASWQWEGTDKVYSLMAQPGEGDYALTKELHRVIGEADAVVAHYGDGFDLPWIQARCLKHGFGPLKPVIQIDTWKIVKRNFKLFNNKLDYVAQYLGLPAKIKTDFDLWRECVRGDKVARARMLLYNEQDVRVLAAVWAKLRPFAQTQLNRALFVSDEMVQTRTCPKCGADKLMSHGMQYTRTGIRRRFQCTACKAWAYKVTVDEVPR